MGKVARVRLGMVLDRPVYHVHVPGAQPRTVFADTGEVLRTVPPESAVRAAAEFAARSGWITAEEISRLRHEGMLQTDQWTVSAALNAHRPLHKIAVNDAPGTVLYVSSTTGEVVRDSQRVQRVLNYFGAVTHWLYPTFIRRHPDAWVWLVDILASIGIALAISGTWIGVLRWRRKRAAGESMTPYRGLMRWHHLTGLAFGVTAVTWVSSGLLSMNPGNLNPSGAPQDEEALAFAGTVLTVADFEAPDADTFGASSVEAELLHYDRQPFYKVTNLDGSVRLSLARWDGAAHLPRVEDLLARAPALMPGTRVARAYLMTQYDDYYYTRRPEHGGTPLPVIRVQFADEQHTWFHVDPTTGQVLERSTRLNRVYRWLYNGLHSWDIHWLRERRPLWDIAVLGFLLGGLVLSILGVIAGVRRLRWELGIARRPVRVETRTGDGSLLSRR